MECGQGEGEGEVRRWTGAGAWVTRSGQALGESALPLPQWTGKPEGCERAPGETGPVF